MSSVVATISSVFIYVLIGYFLKNGTISIRVPNEIDAKTISLEKAIELIEIKKAKDSEKKKKTKTKTKRKIKTISKKDIIEIDT